MMISSNKLTAIDLFAGAGGLTQGLKQAGFNVIGAVEIDDLAVETYSSNHPDVAVWKRDIVKLSARQIMRSLRIQKGQLDLLAGCPPCQGFSVMRTMNGGREVIDERNDLVFEFIRLVRELLPKTIMMENVPGLASDKRMRKVRRTLGKLGYNSECRVLDAQDYGVPQRRCRMILVGSRVSHLKPCAASHRRQTVFSAISDLPEAGKSGDELHDFPERRTQAVIQLICDIPHDGGSRADLGPERQLRCHQSCNGFKDVYGRMKWHDVAPTITTGCFNPSKGRFLHPVENRNITLREAALLQSFPIDYKISLRRGKTNAAVMIGNALPPLFIEKHAEKIRRSIERAGRNSL